MRESEARKSFRAPRASTYPDPESGSLTQIERPDMSARATGVGS